MSGVEKKKEFNEVLTELVEFATVSGNRLTKDQIKLYFGDLLTDESKYEYIYRYLSEMGVSIDGLEFTKDETAETVIVGHEETEEAKAFYGMYVDEVKKTDKASAKKDINSLLAGHLSGDNGATKSLTEYYLPKIIEISDEYISSPLGRSDIVAEGNLALYEAVVAYDGEADVESFEKHLYDRVRRSIEKAVYEEMGSNRTYSHLVERVNALNDASTEMAKELGREASLQELSDRLALPEDEIKELMKISIDALTVDGE